MSLIWGRQIEVEVAGLTISGPRINLGLTRDGAGAAARCDVRLYNVSKATEKRIRERGERLVAKAGYGRTSQIFEGPITQVTRDRDKASSARVVVIAAGGEELDPNRPGGGQIVRGYDGPRSTHAIIRDVADDAGLRLGPLDAVEDREISWAFSGAARDALEDIDAKLTGVTHYVSDGELRWTAVGRADTGSNRLAISPETGLIGTPRVTDEGVSITIFCNPSARMGTIVDLTSEAVSGTYKVIALSASLDNWEGGFSYELDMHEA